MSEKRYVHPPSGTRSSVTIERTDKGVALKFKRGAHGVDVMLRNDQARDLAMSILAAVADNGDGQP